MNNYFYKIRKNKNKFLNFIKSSDGSLYQKVIRGGFWTFFLRATSQLLHLIKIIVLARLLSPSDFGLFGVALLSLAALETFSQTGFDRALIQKKGDISSYLNSVWTIEVVRGILIAIILFFISPYVAVFFSVPEVVPILRIIGLAVILKGLTNVAVTYFQKELEFKKLFKYQFSGTLADSIITIIIAVLFHSVWALVIGLLVGNLVRLVVSYKINSYRPKFEFNFLKLKELWAFGKWVLGSSILIFLVTHGDDILVGKLLGVTALGFYQMAYLISNVPATEISHIISQVAFPAYSKLQDDIPRLRKAYLKVLRITTFFSFPIAGLIFVLAPDFTTIFLGEKWMPMVPAMQVLGFWGLIRSIGATTGHIFHAVGRPQLLTKLQLIQLILLIILIYPLTAQWKILGASLAVAFSLSLPNLIACSIVIKIIKCKLSVFVRLIMLPLIGAAGLILSILLLKLYWINEINIITFVMFITVGFWVYVFSVGLLDKFFGCGTLSIFKGWKSYFKI